MPYKPNQMLLVLYAIREIGDATIEDVAEYLKEQEISKDEIAICVKRWTAKKVITRRLWRGQNYYKIASIPPFFKSLDKPHLTTMDTKEARTLINQFAETIKKQPKLFKREPEYTDYKSFEMVFETLDPILGGVGNEEEGLEEESHVMPVFPRENGQPVIPMSWIKGWVRDNFKLLGIVGVYRHISCSKGYFLEPVETLKKPAKGARGDFNLFEAVPEGKKFKVQIDYPMTGTAIQDGETLMEALKRMGERPIRGLGWNPNLYGGRCKLVDFKEI